MTRWGDPCDPFAAMERRRVDEVALAVGGWRLAEVLDALPPPDTETVAQWDRWRRHELGEDWECVVRGDE